MSCSRPVRPPCQHVPPFPSHTPTHTHTYNTLRLTHPPTITRTGSCWLHGTLSSVQDRIKILNRGQGPDVMLARQTLLQCGPLANMSNGCNGGEPRNVFDYMMQFGLPDESCMIYKADDQVRVMCICGRVCLHAHVLDGDGHSIFLVFMGRLLCPFPWSRSRLKRLCPDFSPYFIAGANSYSIACTSPAVSVFLLQGFPCMIVFVDFTSTHLPPFPRRLPSHRPSCTSRRRASSAPPTASAGTA